MCSGDADNIPEPTQERMLLSDSKSSVQPRLFEIDKRCTKCGEAKPREEFNRARRENDGLSYWCKLCSKTYTASYRAANREQVLCKERQRYAANPEKYREYRQRWYKAKWQRYYEENRERVKLWGREHRRRLQVQGRGITAEEWMEKLASYEGLCHWCEQPHGEIPHMEHVMPVALGGLHEIENVVPACQRCNFRKGIKHPDEWRIQLEREKRGEQ